MDAQRYEGGQGWWVPIFAVSGRGLRCGWLTGVGSFPLGLASDAHEVGMGHIRFDIIADILN